MTIVIAGSGGGTGVTSFNGRTGAVAPASGDYTFSQVALATVAVNANGNSVASTLEEVTTGGAVISRTLPAPTAGVVIAYKKMDSGTGSVTIIGTIDGQANYSLSVQNKEITLEADGTAWIIW